MILLISKVNNNNNIMRSNTIKITIEYNGNTSVHEIPMGAKPVECNSVSDAISTDDVNKIFSHVPINDQLVDTHADGRRGRNDLFLHACVKGNIDTVKLIVSSVEQPILKIGYNNACFGGHASIVNRIHKYIADADDFSTNLLLEYCSVDNMKAATLLITHIIPKETIFKLLEDETICSNARNDLRTACKVAWCDAFEQACILGNIEDAKAVYIDGLGDSFPNLMRDVCRAGKFVVATWLYSLGYKLAD